MLHRLKCAAILQLQKQVVHIKNKTLLPHKCPMNWCEVACSCLSVVCRCSLACGYQPPSAGSASCALIGHTVTGAVSSAPGRFSPLSPLSLQLLSHRPTESLTAAGGRLLCLCSLAWKAPRKRQSRIHAVAHLFLENDHLHE